MVVIHNEAPPDSLNNYETDWERYDRLQLEDTKRHLGLKTGLQGHVHALPSLRGGPTRWAGEPDVHGIVDKEVVRALLERQDIHGLLPLFKTRLVWITVHGIRVGVVQGLLGKTPFLPSNLLASMAQLWVPPTSPLLPFSPTLTQEFRTQFMCSLVLGRGYTPFQCQTRRGSR